MFLKEISISTSLWLRFEFFDIIDNFIENAACFRFFRHVLLVFAHRRKNETLYVHTEISYIISSSTFVPPIEKVEPPSKLRNIKNICDLQEIISKGRGLRTCFALYFRL